MNRRDFLGPMLAACAAPAIVRADSLMRIVPTETWIAGLPPPHIPVAVMLNCYGVVSEMAKAIHIPEAMDMVNIDRLYRGEKTLRPKIDGFMADHYQVLAGGLLARTEQGTFVGDPKLVFAWKRL